MSKKKPTASKKINAPKPAPVKKLTRQKNDLLFPWLLVVTGITALCLYPMLTNDFTNWDDTFYVTQNRLLHGPDWQGIFTEPVVSNYHPLTIISLAINYGISQLDSSSYLLFNYLLHLLNTALVFYFIYTISDKKKEVAFLTALIFGIHPLHVESVAWVAERKDVLYTFFFLLSLLQYWRYLVTGKRFSFWLSLILFIFSLLSKPAATILPFLLILLDYWKDRKFTSKLIIEKIPFFLAALIIGIITIKIQSRGAIAGFDLYPLWVRPFFACYTVMIYSVRFFVPYPLSAFHPYPSPDHLGAAVLFSPVFIIGLLIFLWYFRKNKLVIFGILFFIINLLLVLQLLSIGFTIVSERYTYVPYIGLAFLISMWLYRKNYFKNSVLIAAVCISVIFGIISFQRTKVWKNGGTLWDDVIRHYPEAPLPRANRAGFNSKLALEPGYRNKKDSLFNLSLADCNYAIRIAPNEPAPYEKRGLINFLLNRTKEAMDDAVTLIRLQPENHMGYFIRGSAYMQLNQPDKALSDFNTTLSMKPFSDFALDSRGSLLVNAFQKYSEALIDFNKAIEINPNVNGYYMNRSICYYKMGNIEKARADAQTAVKLGGLISDYYKGLLRLQ